MGKHHDTALFREARNVNGSAERTRSLIEGGADVNRRHKCGCTPLWQAAYHGREDLVAVLLGAGADPAVCADDGSGPLHWAAGNGHLGVVRLLLAAGADVNAAQESGRSVLAAAVSNGHRDVVGVLVAAGASADHRYFGRSMPEFAEWCRQPEIAALLRRSRRQRLRSGFSTSPTRFAGYTPPAGRVYWW